MQVLQSLSLPYFECCLLFRSERSAQRLASDASKARSAETHAILLELVADVQAISDSISYVDGEVCVEV